MVDVTTARDVSPATTLDASIKRETSSHRERTHDNSATTVVCRKMKVEANLDVHSSDLCGFHLSNDAQILVTCSDGVAPLAQKKDNPHALCTNFISSGFGPWCQNLEVKMSRRCTSFAFQGAMTKEKTYFGSGVTWRRGGWANARNTKTKSGFNLQQLPHKDKGGKSDGVFDRRPSTIPCPYVFRHHRDLGDYITDYRLHHTVQTTSTRDRNTSVSTFVPSFSRLLKEKKLCRVNSSCSSAGTSSISTRSDTLEKRTRSVPNLSPVREKTTERNQKGRLKANKASRPSTDRPSKCLVQCLNNNGTQMEDDKGRQPKGTSLTSEQSSGTKTNVMATKCTTWPTAVFPTLHKLVITQYPLEGGRACRKECKLKVKQSKPRSDACDKLKQDSKMRSLNENIHHPQRKGTSDNGECRTQKESNTVAMATMDKNNSRYTEGPVEGEAEHPYIGYSSFPEVTKLHLTQILQGDGARVVHSRDVTKVELATGGSHHVCSPALTRSVHESCPRLQVTDPAKVKNTPENIASQVHDWLSLGQCVSFPELRLSCMSKPQITASTSGEVSDVTRRHKRSHAGVRGENMWGGKDWVANTQADVAKETNVNEETRNRTTSDGDRGVHGPLNISTSNHKHATQKASVDRGGKSRQRDRGNTRRRTIDHQLSMGRTPSSKNTQLRVVAQSLGVRQVRNREQRTTGNVHLDLRVSTEAVQKTVAEVTM